MTVDTTNCPVTASEFTAVVGAASDDSDTIAYALNHASAWLNRTCGYGVKARALTEYYDGDASNVLWLKASPVASVQLWCDSSRTFGSDTLLVEDTDFVVYADEGKVVLLSGSLPAGAQTVKATYTGGYDTSNIAWYDFWGLVLRAARWFYDSVKNAHIGVTSVTSGGGGQTSFTQDVPDEIATMAEPFTRPERGVA